LDHLLLAVPDLCAGMEAFAALTGVAPMRGGAHAGYGTHNALVGLGAGIYLELIAPDPAQPLEGTLGGAIAARRRAGMLSFCLAADDLETAVAPARQAGLALPPPAPMGRTRPDGLRMDWIIQRLDETPAPGVLPFLIDWRGAPHPSASTPTGCRLVSLVALSPDPEPLRRLYAALGIAVPVASGLREELVAELETPRGRLVLTGG
jgi:hypothetical protein